MAGPLIVTAELGASDFAWLDGLRREHFPAERNRVPAHLTLFRSLPPGAEAEVRRALARACTEAAPKATISGLMDLGSGVAVRVRSDDLDSIREQLVDHFHGLLTPQDSSGWIPHVTVQNKVERGTARELLRRLEPQIEPRPLAIRGLLLFRYADGLWDTLGGYRFRGT
ncbi:MAG: 2'-5' RNA ligase family protein [Pseudomonadota bacterium]|nr:2'-5' RNA ligase family protein [Pseudomonadota bacterium]